jgi:hypothetical protein
MRKAFMIFAAASLLSTPVLAAQCRDAKGKFIKCPEKPAPVVKKGPCKDAKGKFIKCPK